MRTPALTLLPRLEVAGVHSPRVRSLCTEVCCLTLPAISWARRPIIVLVVLARSADLGLEGEARACVPSLPGFLLSVVPSDGGARRPFLFLVVYVRLVDLGLEVEARGSVPVPLSFPLPIMCSDRPGVQR